MEHLAWAREENDMTQEDLADVLGMSRNFVSRLENGHTTATEEQIKLLTDHLGYEAVDLL